MEISFPDANTDGLEKLISEEFPQTQEFTIKSREDFENVISVIKNTPKPFINQVFIVNIPTIDEESNFDVMVANIEKAFEKRTYGKHISAIVGKEMSEQTQRRNLQNLQEDQVHITEQESAPILENVQPTPSPVYFDASFIQEPVFTGKKLQAVKRTKYLTSTVLLGIIIGLITAIAIIYGLLSMLDIQSPCIFVEKSIDWGHIEH